MQITIENTIGSGKIYLQIMKVICGGIKYKSVLDLMCHKSPYTPQLGFKERTYIDILDRQLDFKEEQKYFVQSDVIDYLCNGNHYDVSIAADAIEHLTITKGITLLSLMQQYSCKQIIFTPLGDYLIETKSKHPDTHKSGWLDTDFQKLGWATITLPNFHIQLNIGAFFAWNCEDIEEDFERVKNELKEIL